MSEVPWYDFDDFLYYGSPKDPRFKIEPPQNDEDLSAESDDDPIVKIKLAHHVRKLQPQTGTLRTTAEVLADDSEIEITAMLRKAGIEKFDDNYKLSSSNTQKIEMPKVKSKRAQKTSRKNGNEPKMLLHMDSEDFKLVPVFKKSQDSDNSSSDATFYTAHGTFNDSSKLTTCSQDRSLFTPRELYMKKNTNQVNDTV